MQAVFVNILSPGDDRVVQGDPWAKGIVIRWNGGSGGFQAYGVWKERCCSSPLSLQREIKLTLNRYTWCAWREGEGKKSKSKGLSVAGERELGYGPHNLEWAFGEVWTRAMELDEEHDFFYKSGKRSWERFLQDWMKSVFGRMGLDEFEGLRYAWVMLLW